MKKQTSVFRTFTMIVFWALVWAWGPSLFTYSYSLKGLTVTYLIITMLSLYVVARMNEVSFSKVVGDNNWVFPSVIAMTVVSAMMDSANPHVPAAPFVQWWHMITDDPILYDPYAEDSLWGMLNRLYFGEVFTRGWKTAMWTYFFWAIPAFFISFWDEIKNHKKEIAVVAGALLAADVLKSRNKK